MYKYMCWFFFFERESLELLLCEIISFVLYITINARSSMFRCDWYREKKAHKWGSSPSKGKYQKQHKLTVLQSNWTVY